jgi:hypothetical protein
MMEYLLAAYAILWAVSFVLVLSMVWRQRRIESEIRALRILVDDLPPSDPRRAGPMDGDTF